MKIGITEASFSQLKEERYKKIYDSGFKFIDFDMANTETSLYKCSSDEFIKRLKAERELAESAGLCINQVHGPWRWEPRDATEEDRAERMEKMKKSIFGTSILGCENWVIHPIMPFGIYDKGTENEKITWDLNIKFMKELTLEGKKYGVTVCVENMPMPEFSIASPDEILKLVGIIDDENFKVCFDTGHAAICEGSKIGDAVRRTGEALRVLHVHDNNGISDLHRMPFYGIIDWEDFNEALKDVRYSGVFSLEAGPAKRLPAEIFDDVAKIMYKCALKILDKGGK